MMDLWLNRYRVRSTAILTTAMGMLIYVVLWGTSYAEGNTRTGNEIALILAAVQTPATFLAGWAFKIFQENKET